MERITLKIENHDISLNKAYISIDGEKAVVNKHETTPEVAETEVMNLIKELLVNNQLVHIKGDIDLTKSFKTMKIYIQTNEKIVRLYLENINKLHKVLSFVYMLLAGYRTVCELSNTDFMLGDNLCVSNYENKVCVLSCE